jgi:hypothetical protein
VNNWHLARLTTSVYLRRLTGTKDRRALRVPLYILGTVVAVALSGLTSDYLYLAIRSTASLAGLLTPLISIVGFVVSGSIVLGAEGARDKGGSLTAVLSSLPLRQVEVRLLAWSPLIGIVSFFELLLLPPLVAGFLGSGLAFGSAAMLAVDVAVIGFSSAATALEITYVLLRSQRWFALRTPTAMLFWIVIAAVEIWASIESMAHSVVSLPWLLLPQIAYSTANNEPVPLSVTLVALLVAAVLAAAFIPIVADGLTGKPSHVRILWEGRFSRSRLVGELVYAFRSPSLVGNLVAALLVNVAIAGAFQAVGATNRETILGPAAAAVCISAGVGARLARPLHPSRRTVAQMVGVGRTSWTLGQSAIGFFCYFILALPALAIVSAGSDSDRVHIALLLVTSFAIAHLSSWLIVVPLDNSLGQFLGGLIIVTITSVFYFVYFDWFRAAPFASAFICVAVVLLATFITVAAERQRWRFTDGDTEPSLISGSKLEGLPSK